MSFSLAAGYLLNMIKTLRPLVLAGLLLPFALPSQAAAVSTSLPPKVQQALKANKLQDTCLLYTSPSPRDATLSRMPSSA